MLDPLPPAAERQPISHEDRRRIGRFNIHHDLLHDFPHECGAIFDGLVVLRAESRYDRQVIEYSAWGMVFAPVPDYLMPPEYEAIATKQEDGSVTVAWKRV